MLSQDAKARGEEHCRPLAASHLVSMERGGCALIGNKKHPGANSAKLRPQVENFGSVFAKSRRVEDQVSLRPSSNFT